MTNRVNFWHKLVLALILAMAGLVARVGFADDLPLPQPPTVVDEAVAMVMGAEDLANLSRGLEDALRPQVFRGQLEDRYQRRWGWFTLSLEGISYRFRVRRVDLVPRDGRLFVRADVDQLAVNIRQISFNKRRTRYCRNTTITDGGLGVPVQGELIGNTAGGKLDLSWENERILLARDNFVVHRPQSCRVLWGTNWMIRRALPVVANMVRKQIAEAVSEVVFAKAAGYFDIVDRLLRLNISYPLDIKPIPSFLATIALWPADLSVSRDAMTIKLGASLQLDRDPEERFEPAPSWTQLLPQPTPSYVGVSRSLLRALFEQGRGADLFNFRLNQNNWSNWQDVLSLEQLARIAPDAATRFAGEEHDIALALARPEASDVILHPYGPGGIPIIEGLLQRQPAQVTVDGIPYLDLMGKASLQVALVAGEGRQRLALLPQELALDLDLVGFAAGVTPSPNRLDQTAWADTVNQLNQQLDQTLQPWVDLNLPEMGLGRTAFELVGTSLRDEDWLSLDIRLQRE